MSLAGLGFAAAFGLSDQLDLETIAE